MRIWVQLVIALVCLACGPGSLPSTSDGAHLSTAIRDLRDGQVVDGVPCLRDDLPARHFHIHIAVFLDGQALTVPAGIGVGRPWGVSSDGFIATGSCFAWIHSHDSSGVVHVFTQLGKSDTLGQVFSIWGQPLNAEGALGFHGPIAVLVNGQELTGDPRSVPLSNLQNIVIELGKPPTTDPPALYDFGTMRR